MTFKTWHSKQRRLSNTQWFSSPHILAGGALSISQTSPAAIHSIPPDVLLLLDPDQGHQGIWLHSLCFEL